MLLWSRLAYINIVKKRSQLRLFRTVLGKGEAVLSDRLPRVPPCLEPGNPRLQELAAVLVSVLARPTASHTLILAGLAGIMPERLPGTFLET